MCALQMPLMRHQDKATQSRLPLAIIQRRLHPYPRHPPAFFGAVVAGARARLAMRHRVVAAFGAARFANFGTNAAQVHGELRAAAHQGCRRPADVGAVAVEPDAKGHLGDVNFPETGRAAVLAFLGTADACFDACSIVVAMRHDGTSVS
jgi:hypothetical protein